MLQETSARSVANIDLCLSTIAIMFTIHTKPPHRPFIFFVAECLSIFKCYQTMVPHQRVSCS